MDDASTESHWKHVLEELYRKLTVAFCSRHSLYEADDLVQEALKRIMIRRDQYQNKSEAELGWIALGIVRNIRREIDKRRRSPMQSLPEALGFTDPQFVDVDRVDVLRRAGELLEGKDRALWDSYLELDGDRRAIARRLGLTPEAVSVRLHRLFPKVRALLGGDQ